MSWRQRNTGTTGYLPRILLLGILACTQGPGGAAGRPALNLKLELGLNHSADEPLEMPWTGRQAESSTAVTQGGHPNQPMGFDLEPTGKTTPGATSSRAIRGARPGEPIDLTMHNQAGPSYFRGGGDKYAGKQVGVGDQQVVHWEGPYYRFFPDSLAEDTFGSAESLMPPETEVRCSSEESVVSPDLLLGLSLDSAAKQTTPPESPLPRQTTHTTEARGRHGFPTAEPLRQSEPLEALAYWTAHQLLSFTPGVLLPATPPPLFPVYSHPHNFQLRGPLPFRPDLRAPQRSAQWPSAHTQPYSVAGLYSAPRNPNQFQTNQPGRVHRQGPENQRNLVASMGQSGVTLEEWPASDGRNEQAHLRRENQLRRAGPRYRVEQSNRAGLNREHSLSTRAPVGFKKAHGGSSSAYGFHLAEASNMRNRPETLDPGTRHRMLDLSEGPGLDHGVDTDRTRYQRPENAHQQGGNTYHWPGLGAVNTNPDFNYQRHQG